MDEGGLRFGGGDFGYGELLAADLGSVEGGAEIDAERGRVAELSHGGHGAVVADDAGVEGGGVAVGVDGDAGDVVGAEIFVGGVALAVGKRAGGEVAGS